MIEHSVLPADAGQRLDRYLRKLLPGAALSLIHRLLRQGRIRVDEVKATGATRIESGAVLAIEVPADEDRRLTAPARRAKPKNKGPAPRQRKLVTLYRDEHLLAVDKPVGMASQPGSGVEHDSLVAWLAAELAEDAAPSRTFHPAPAHRLDRETSGVVVIGMSTEGLRGLHAAFAENQVKKTYLAVVRGEPKAAQGEIDAPLLRVEATRGDQPKVVVDPAGRPAYTEYRVIETRARRSLLEVHITTGRMHQIRAHLAHLRHPIVGDRRYGEKPRPGERLRLHAVELELDHPVTGVPLQLRAEMPKGFWP